MMTVVLALGIAHIVQCSLKTSDIILHESDTQVQSLLRGCLADIRESAWDVHLGPHNKALGRLRERLAEGESEERENEQASCNHCVREKESESENEGTTGTSEGERCATHHAEADYIPAEVDAGVV